MQPSYFLQVRRVLLVVLGLNLLVATLKLTWGLGARSASMVADGFHSYADSASNVAGLMGMWVASKPVDTHHPYGHKKYETLASMVIAALLFGMCIEVFQEGWRRLAHPLVPEVTLGSFLVMAVTLVTNIGVSTFERREGLRLGSDVLLADALHTRSDIIVSLSVVGSLIAVRLGWPIADALVALGVVFFIAWTAIRILKKASDVLCDRAVLSADQVRGVVGRIPGVRECHGVRTRGRQDDIHVDLHAIVSDELPVQEAHTIADRIEHEVKSAFRGVTDVVVHIEPSAAHPQGQESDR